MPIPESIVTTYAPLLERSVGAEAAWVLLRHMELCELAPGQELVVYGQRSDTLYLLCSGRLQASLPLGDGERLLFGNVEPGHWLGEVNIIEPGPASATVMASQPSQLFALDHAALQEIEAIRPEVATRLLGKLTQDLAARLRRSTSGVLERVDNHEYRLASAPQKRSWLGRLLGGLMGARA